MRPAFGVGYGLARFAGRGRAVAVLYGLWAALRARRARRLAPDALQVRSKERLP